ncbi:UDP-N-acetylmuramate dehydrogenase [Aquirufa nivalisilvae]|uniref:UDP-N-acetylenolpyruvoylglucosamine reductase n=1 Tax=Aquirufa nivalisilvae TaxID=2516557 RepID=A0A2S2DTQ0_9BACT|nr:UDP-N-acetylmuramate dehydrogenase [Aquirufa nivalisilvae]AWL08756.1 UDP-N-acetylmuramate dehydrogenase [Aquirufa nivalisilvae]TBH74775.1 UDP-N-acetylmuramate dehydrogenase [Aquirufa nivalisilvae]
MPSSIALPRVLENYSIQSLNTFGIDVKARYFVEIRSIEQYHLILNSGTYSHVPHIFLGGGSNVLLTQDLNALVVKVAIDGIEVIKEDDQHVWVRAGAGVVWHDFVQYTVSHQWAGIENLSLIPGTVGAAPMQNIGAYGVEIKDTFDHLQAFNLSNYTLETFDTTACQFGYRESYFKHEGKGKYLIAYVCFKLNKVAEAQTSYGAIQEVLHAKSITHPSIQDVSNAVIEIRQSKLPDPKEIGNSGSFFKNPTLKVAQATELMEKYPNIPHYPVTGSSDIKFPAGWLIEQAGWKGFREGDAGVHAKQALVLVNYGQATGKQILALSEQIKQSILSKFGVALETEVNIL